MSPNSRKNIAQKTFHGQFREHPYNLTSDAKINFAPNSSSSEYKEIYEPIEIQLKRKRANDYENRKEKYESPPSKKYKLDDWNISKPDVPQSEVRATPRENGNQGQPKNMDENNMRQNVPKIEKNQKPHTKELLNDILKTSKRGFPEIENWVKRANDKSIETLKLTKIASDHATKKFENIESAVKRTSTTQVNALERGFQEQKQDLGNLSKTVTDKQNRQESELQKITNKITGMTNTLVVHSTALAKIKIYTANPDNSHSVNFKETFDPFIEKYNKDTSELNDNFHTALKLINNISQSFSDVDIKREQHIELVRMEQQKEKDALEKKIDGLTNSINTMSNNFNENISQIITNITQKHTEEKNVMSEEINALKLEMREMMQECFKKGKQRLMVLLISK